MQGFRMAPGLAIIRWFRKELQKVTIGTKKSAHLPIGSMYGIFTYIYHEN